MRIMCNHINTLIGDKPLKFPSPGSVADPECLSRILIFIHPESRIPDPTTGTKELGEQNFVALPVLQPQISQNCKLFLNW
jgi:hypothetical protein